MKYKRYKFGCSSNYNAIISSIWLFILLVLLLTASSVVQCSEFPERECCDPPPIYPPNVPDSENNNNVNGVESPIEPILPTITTSLSLSTIQPIIGRSGKLQVSAFISFCSRHSTSNFLLGNSGYSTLLNNTKRS